MTAVLKTDELSDKERAFIRGVNVKGAVASSTPEPVEAPPAEANSEEPTAPVQARQKPALHGVPATVGFSTRIPMELSEKLMRASFERKLSRVQPWTHQDIVTEALTEWLKKRKLA